MGSAKPHENRPEKSQDERPSFSQCNFIGKKPIPGGIRSALCRSGTRARPKSNRAVQKGVPIPAASGFCT